MALRNIVTSEDPVLRKVSRPVTKFDSKLAMLIDDMKETLKNADGAGLAAVQVGVLRRVVIVDVDEGKEALELVNPEITFKSDELEECEEACLSVPGEGGIVARPKEVSVKAQDRKGEWHTYSGTGLKARCFCHELDHLDGHLYTDFAIRMLSDDDIRRMREERSKANGNGDSK